MRIENKLTDVPKGCIGRESNHAICVVAERYTNKLPARLKGVRVKAVNHKRMLDERKTICLHRQQVH